MQGAALKQNGTSLAKAKKLLVCNCFPTGCIAAPTLTVMQGFELLRAFLSLYLILHILVVIIIFVGTLILIC